MLDARDLIESVLVAVITGFLLGVLKAGFQKIWNSLQARAVTLPYLLLNVLRLRIAGARMYMSDTNRRLELSAFIAASYISFAATLSLLVWFQGFGPVPQFSPQVIIGIGWLGLAATIFVLTLWSAITVRYIIQKG